MQDEQSADCLQKEFLCDGVPQLRRYAVRMLGQKITPNGLEPCWPEIVPETRENEIVINRIGFAPEIFTDLRTTPSSDQQNPHP